MSETRPMPPVAPDSDQETQEKPRLSRRRYLRHLMWGGAGLALVLILGVIGLYFFASSSRFENIVRKRLITQIEAATGGRAEIGTFHWNLLKLELEADGVVLHGREPAGETPYAQLASLRVDLDVLGLWSPRVLLRNLVLERPQIHLIVNRDGSTNQPQPRTKSETRVLDTLFDLQAGHVEVNNGLIDFDERSDESDFQDRHIPLDFAANDVSLLLKYVPAAAHAGLKVIALLRVCGGAPRCSTHRRIFSCDRRLYSQCSVPSVAPIDGTQQRIGGSGAEHHGSA